MESTPFKRLREKAGDDVTQKQVADSLGRTVATIGNWERCETAPSLVETPELMRAYSASRNDVERTIVETNRIIAANKQLASAR